MQQELNIVDCTGLKCPLPRLKFEKWLKIHGLDVNQTLILIATDPMAKLDIPEIALQYGLSCSLKEEKERLIFHIFCEA